MSGNLAHVMAQTKKAQAEAKAEVPVKVAKSLALSKDPNLVKVTLYIHDKVRKDAAKRLIDEKRELSYIVDQLLDAWLSGKIHV